MDLALSLLGEIEISLNGNVLEDLCAEKAQALLFYLAVESNRAHRREFLAEMFWPEKPPGYARNNLKQTLSQLKKALGDTESDTPFLISSKRDLQFNAGCPHRIDVLELESLFQRSKHHEHKKLADCEGCIEALHQAIELYRDDFLSDFYLPDSPDFNEWAITKREYLRRLVVDSLNKLIDYYESQNEYKKSAAFAKELVELEPWNESSHRKLMALLAASGKRSAALKQYQTCIAMLASEFDAQPTPETTALYERIKDWQVRDDPSSKYPSILTSPVITGSSQIREKSLSTWINISALVSFFAIAAVLYFAFFRDNLILTGSSQTGTVTESEIAEGQILPTTQAGDIYYFPSDDGASDPLAAAVILNDPNQSCWEDEKPLYREDFQDDQAQGWPEIDFRAQNWDIVPDPENPENLVIQNPGTHEATTYLEGHTFDDAVWRLNFYKIGRPEYIFIWQHVPDPYESKSGIVYSSDYSMAFLYDGTHFYRFAYPVPDVVLLGIPKTIANEVWHTIEISTYQGELEVWLDGKQLLSYQDPDPLPGGKLGLGLWLSRSAGSMVYFDNLTVCELNEPFKSIFTK